MRVLIIGGSGFIGPSVVRLLSRMGHEVAVFHRGKASPELPAGVQEILGDRRQLEVSAVELRRFAPDVVVDMILSSGRQAEALMRFFQGVARRVVALSSGDVYRACGVMHGSEPGPLQPLPLSEESDLRQNPQTYPPELVRKAQEMFSWFDDEYDKIPVEKTVMGVPEVAGTVLRLPMIYGPGDHVHRLFPILKRVDDRRPRILVEERLARWRGPRGYMENVAQAVALAAASDRAAARIYNVAEPQAFTEREWTRTVAAAAGFRGEIITLPQDRAPAHLKAHGNPEQHWVYDTTRIRTELGYTEAVPLDEALERTIEWERANPPAEIDPKQFDYAAEDAAVAQVAR